MYSPKEVAQNYIATGAAKTKLPVAKMLVLGILAGMFIALAGVGTTIASATISNPAIQKTVSALLFPAGLAMTLIAGSELFTGNSLIIISVLEKQARVSGMLKNWLFVYIGNFIGGLLVALITVYGGTYELFGSAAGAALIHTAIAKTSMAFGDALLRGILCNFLVCIAVWMAFAAKDVIGKIAGLFFPIMLFVVSGFEHSVANMYYISAGLLARGQPGLLATANNLYPTDVVPNLTWGNFIFGNLLPVTIGNIIGGMVLVGVGYWFAYLRETAGKLPARAGGKRK